LCITFTAQGLRQPVLRNGQQGAVLPSEGKHHETVFVFERFGAEHHTVSFRQPCVTEAELLW
jgi:hypothetical protein